MKVDDHLVPHRHERLKAKRSHRSQPEDTAQKGAQARHNMQGRAPVKSQAQHLFWPFNSLSPGRAFCCRITEYSKNQKSFPSYESKHFFFHVVVVVVVFFQGTVKAEEVTSTDALLLFFFSLVVAGVMFPSIVANNSSL